ncbi:TetR/AcrR family transcriptional regulator [Alkalicoccus halolimnae]|uniref:TetR/AcrR family transcriptional regulator n=1 Tax=Alkalicoccus halolimnae TaxID=1667239 RepID=A0A5C7F3B5_9BACI|nr:TetR/AcrR family transcriptional regulator [Alkalicoccus halolimnae]TXF85102.1 TetR/AcrR family transcriptional regulator [Alkalicoccus halolimnae]
MKTTVTDLIRVSMREFSLHGYDGASLSSIAASTGIKKSSIYNHFSNKQTLFLGVVDTVYDAYIEHLKAAAGPGSSMTLKEILEKTAVYLANEENGRFYLHFVLFPPPALQQEIRSRFLSFEEDCSKIFRPRFEAMIHEGIIREQPIEPLLDSFYCLMDGICVQRLYYDEKLWNRKYKAAWDVFWNGIGGKPYA